MTTNRKYSHITSKSNSFSLLNPPNWGGEGWGRGKFGFKFLSDPPLNWDGGEMRGRFGLKFTSNPPSTGVGEGSEGGMVLNVKC